MKNSKFMFDTQIFDRILDGKVDILKLKVKGKYFTTHIQLDELEAVTDSKRKNNLLSVFHMVNDKKLPTESAVWDVSKWDESKWSSETELTPTESFLLGVSRLGNAKLGTADIYSLIKAELDLIKTKPNNIKDSLLAETAIKNKFVLVTDDKNLKKVVKKIGGSCISFAEYQNL